MEKHPWLGQEKNILFENLEYNVSHAKSKYEHGS